MARFTQVKPSRAQASPGRDRSCTTRPSTEEVIKVGKNPLSVASGDLNHDGHLDLVVANLGDPNLGGGNLSIILGNGDGTFQPPHTLNIIDRGINRSPNFITLGDFNDDGNLDIVACTDDQGGPSLLPGNGKGGFGKPSLIPISGGGCDQVLTADLDGDREADLMFRLPQNPFGLPAVFVALGKGNGTFSPTQVVSSADVFGIAVGDLNNDGIPDLVLAEPGALETLLGDGHGKFTSQGFFLGPAPSSFHPGLIPALGGLTETACWMSRSPMSCSR
jgi:hypothetical protein